MHSFTATLDQDPPFNTATLSRACNLPLLPLSEVDFGKQIQDALERGDIRQLSELDASLKSLIRQAEEAFPGRMSFYDEERWDRLQDACAGFNVIGYHQSPDRSAPLSFAAGVIYSSFLTSLPEASNLVAMNETNWVAAHSRRCGVGSAMYHRLVDKLANENIAYLFSEHADPALRTVAAAELLDDTAGIDASSRLRFFSSVGELQVDAPYWQADTENLPLYDELMIAVKGCSRDFSKDEMGNPFIDGSLYVEMIRLWFDSFGIKDARSDKSFRLIEQCCKNRPLYLIPLEARRKCVDVLIGISEEAVTEREQVALITERAEELFYSPEEIKLLFNRKELSLAENRPESDT